MCSAWLVVTVALLAADAGTGARLHRDAPLYCYNCERAACSAGELRAERCPRDRPLCATVALAPDFSTTLICAEAAKEACSLLTTNETLRVSCVCSSDLCNRPFSHEFVQHLIMTSADFANVSQIFHNMTDIYSNLTDLTTNAEIAKPGGPVTTTVRAVSDPREPRIEALKSSVPSDDDEDESEGSGTWAEDSKKRPISDPAAPSSHLPAEGNKAANVILDVSMIASIVLHTL